MMFRLHLLVFPIFTVTSIASIGFTDSIFAQTIPNTLSQSSSFAKGSVQSQTESSVAGDETLQSISAFTLVLDQIVELSGSINKNEHPLPDSTHSELKIWEGLPFEFIMRKEDHEFAISGILIAKPGKKLSLSLTVAHTHADRQRRINTTVDVVPEKRVQIASLTSQTPPHLATKHTTFVTIKRKLQMRIGETSDTSKE